MSTMTHPMLDLCSMETADIQQELESLLQCTEFELRQCGYHPTQSYVAHVVSRILRRYEPSEHTDALIDALESYQYALQ